MHNIKRMQKLMGLESISKRKGTCRSSTPKPWKCYKFTPLTFWYTHTQKDKKHPILPFQNNTDLTIEQPEKQIHINYWPTKIMSGLILSNSLALMQLCQWGMSPTAGGHSSHRDLVKVRECVFSYLVTALQLHWCCKLGQDWVIRLQSYTCLLSSMSH